MIQGYIREVSLLAPRYSPLATVILAILLIASSPTPSNTQQSPQDATTSPERPVVHIDAIVTDRDGKPIVDLRPDEFLIEEDGDSQVVNAAALERAGMTRTASGDDTRPATGTDDGALVDPVLAEQREAQQPGTRLIGLFLDDYHVSPGQSADAARDALARFVEQDIQPDDLVVAMKPLDSLTSIRLTRDRQAIEQAIASFAGLRGNYTPRNPFEREIMGRAPAEVDGARAQVVISGLRALAMHLGRLQEGRKAIVLVSEGFMRPPSRGPERLPDVQSVVRTANRFGVAIYAVAPGNVEGGSAGQALANEPPNSRAVLQTLAQQTNGEAILHDRDLAAGLRRVARDLDAYYRVSYQSTRPRDGKFHGLTVRVKRPGATVRAPSGYWANVPVETFTSRRTNLPSRPGLSAPTLRLQHRSNLIQPWFSITRAPDGRTRIAFAWVPNTNVPAAQWRADITSVVLTAVSADNTSIFNGRVSPALTDGLVDGAPERAVFDAPPGVLAVDLKIEGPNERVLDVDTRNINVPNLNGPEVVIATPEVLRTRSAREFREVSLNATALPTHVRDFRRTERLLVRVPAYGPGDEKPIVTARLLSRLGQPLRDLLPVPATLQEGVTQFDLSLAAFAPADYTIEINAATGEKKATERLRIRVIN